MTTAHKTSISEMIEAFAAYKDTPGNEAWGSLHVVLDDSNIGDDSVRHCLDRAKEVGDVEGVKLAETLLTMSKTQRRKLPGVVEDFITGRADTALPF